MSPQQVNLKQKTVMFYDNGLFIELAIHLAKSFGKVYYYTPWKNAFPKSTSVLPGFGIDQIIRVNEFWDYFDDIDIFVFPDVYDGDLQEHLLSLGKRVWGARKGEELELLRAEAKEHLKKIGCDVQPYKKIIGLENLRNYLRSSKNKYVKISTYRGDFETFHHEDYKMSEPKLDELEHNLGARKYITEFIVEDAVDNAVEVGFDGFTVDGEYPEECVVGYEIKDVGYAGVYKKYSDLPRSITDFNKKISPTLKAFGYRGFMSTELRVQKSTGKSYMIDFCFSDDTEVLTDSGWKLFKNCNAEDKFATLNTTTKEIEYQHATDYIEQCYTGKMVSISNRKGTVDMLVTPNHEVLRYDRYKSKLFKEAADSLTDKGFIPRTGNWKGSGEDFITIPAYHKEWDFVGNHSHLVCTRVKHENAIKIPMVNWAAFLGWYLSEGSTSTKYVTQISQTKHPEKVKAVLDSLPFKYNYDGKEFRISSVQLTSFLKQFGLCDKKYVPEYIKMNNPEVIESFLRNFNLGDGSIHKNNRVYYTSSRRLADDIQECIFKIGSVANIARTNSKGSTTIINNKQYTRKHDKYVLYESNKNYDFWFETGYRRNNYIKEVDYDGKVYCLTVPNHTLYVRRKGKPFWSGNCARAGSPPNELYQEMYANLAEIIWYGAEGVMVKPKPVAKYGIEVMIHSSWADKNWQSIEFPDEIRQWVKLRNLAYINNCYYIVPQSQGLPEIGAVVAVGNTLEQAIEKVRSYIPKIRGYYIDIKDWSIDTVMDVIQEGEKQGIKLF